MKTIWRLIRATLVGGLLFLVPLILMGLVLGKGLQLARKIVGPIVQQLPIQTVGGVAVATLASAVLLIAIALLVGVFARTKAGRRVKDWLESTILGKVPAYSIVRGMIAPSSLAEGEASPALAWVEDSWVYALVMEIHEDGHRTVFLPGAPDPLSGSLYFLTEDRVRPLDMTLPAFLKVIRSIGVGSKTTLQGKLSPPTG